MASGPPEVPREAPTQLMRKVLVLYNCDYDPSPPPRFVARRDRSEVSRAAHEVTDAVAGYGLEAEILGVEGRDLGACLERIKKIAPDLVFNLTESLAQDSAHEIVMPAVLDMFGIPYTGSGAMGLGMCLNKPRAKDIMRARGVPTPASCTLHRAKDAAGVDLPFPLFVKLAREDASVGIIDDNVIWDRRSLVKRVRNMIEEFQQPVLIERYVEGREVYVTVLGNVSTDGPRATGSGGSAPGRPTLLPFHEIDFTQMPEGRPHIVGYAAKWDETSPEYRGTVPVPVQNMSEAVRKSVGRCAIEAFHALELRDYGRVDFRVAEDGTPYVIDVNPNCDISPDAGVARAARASGLSYPQLIGRICEVAWERTQNAAAKARAA